MLKSTKTIVVEVMKQPDESRLCRYKKDLGWVLLPKNYEERDIVIGYLEFGKLPRGYAISYKYEGEEFV